jgi:DNA repair protein RecO (recombination protein O)
MDHMLEKTRGIILNQIKYTDSGIIANVYTRKFGRQSFLIKGMRKRKSGKHNILFQPMFILDLEMYYKASREMQTLKEFSASFTPFDIHSNIKKSCVAIFLGEVLSSVLKEESPHEEMFDFIEESIIYFDKCKEGFANFHIAFLTGLSSFLGLEPGTRTNTDDVFFDMLNGKFVPIPPVHGNYANPEISNTLADFFIASYNTISNITLTGVRRNEVLDVIVRYYSIHLPGLKKIKSLEVLKEVFS